MTERDSGSSSPPSAESAGQTSSQLLTLMPSSLGVSSALLGEKLAALLAQWAPVLSQLNEAVEEMARQLAPQAQALQEWMRGPEVQHFARGLAATGELLEAAPTYCAPYARELDRLGMRPLVPEEQRELMIFALLLQDREEMRLGRRLPLAELALVAGRLDITAALVMERAATQQAIRWMERSNKQDEGEFVAAAYLGFRERILPSIQRRLSKVPLRDARRLLPAKLKQVVRDAYLVKSIKRALVQQLEREARRNRNEIPWDEEAQQRLAQMRQELADDNPDLSWAIERGTASFLERPGASELDRKLVAEWRRRPDSSARDIARRIGEPARTVQDHCRILLGYLEEQRRA